MKSNNKNYDALKAISKKARTLGGISSLLEWDQETYMPEGAAPIRGEQLKVLAGIIHKERTSPRFKKVLGKLIDLKTGEILDPQLSEPQKAAVKEWREDYRKETALPAKFVQDFAELTSKSIVVWRNAKKTEGFLHFAPFLEKLVLMNRKKADYLGYQDNPYDALLDCFEPGLTTQEVTTIFSKLRDGIVKLLGKITSAKEIDDSLLFGNFNREKQIEFSHEILKHMGYDQHFGRLDFSAHPFSSAAHPTDSRITTRIHPQSLISNISVILHEAGHALYEMGLPQEEYGSPLGESISLGMHESQSRWWETRIGQSKVFWQHYLPLLKKYFPEIEKISLDDFYRAMNKVSPTMIRVEADEVTYGLHVILRFEMERDLINGTLKIRDIPDAWNEKMEQLLGIKPSCYSEGCLQDIHWSMGSFGYFPTYTLGNLYAAQLFKAFEQKQPDWQARVSKGELIFIKDWLNENIHRFGRQYRSKNLVKKITGEAFSEKPYLDYLNHKYQDIYGFKSV